MMPAKNLMSSVTRQAAWNVRHVATSRHAMTTYKVETENEFRDKVMNGGKPVVVEFTATWCRPCKELLPSLEAAMQQADNKVDHARVDIDDLPGLAEEHKVNAIPTLLAVNKNGLVLDKLMGLQRNMDELASFINKVKDY